MRYIARKNANTVTKTPKPLPTVPVNPNVYRPMVSAEKEQSLLDDILGSLDEASTTLPTQNALPHKRKPAPSPYSSSPDHYSFHPSLIHSTSSEHTEPSSNDNVFNFSAEKRRR